MVQFDVMQGSSNLKTAGNWSFHDLLFDDVDATKYLGGGGSQLASGFQVGAPLHDVKLDHLTIVTNGIDGHILTMGTDPTNPVTQMGPLQFTNNIVRAGKFVIWSTGVNNAKCVVNCNTLQSFTKC